MLFGRSRFWPVIGGRLLYVYDDIASVKEHLSDINGTGAEEGRKLFSLDFLAIVSWCADFCLEKWQFAQVICMSVKIFVFSQHWDKTFQLLACHKSMRIQCVWNFYHFSHCLLLLYVEQTPPFTTDPELHSSSFFLSSRPTGTRAILQRQLRC